MHPRQRLILNFHGLGSAPAHVDADEAPFWLPVEFFAEVLRRTAGMVGVDITFDDGNVSDFDSALPELARHGRTAEFFLVASKIDEPGYLTRTQIKEMVGASMTIGTHGMAHRRWPDCDDQTLAEEINDARELIAEAAGVAVTSASCPFGAYDRRTLRALRLAGLIASTPAIAAPRFPTAGCSVETRCVSTTRSTTLSSLLAGRRVWPRCDRSFPYWSIAAASRYDCRGSE